MSPWTDSFTGTDGRHDNTQAVSTLKAALVTPLSGPLARYGAAGAAALTLWAERVATLAPPWSHVELEVIDAHPSAAAAMRTATLRQPDILFGPYGSGPAVAAIGATDRAVWNHGGATDRLCRPTYAHAINVVSPASSYFAGALHAIRAADTDAHKVSLLHTTTGFGREVAAGAVRICSALGFEVRPASFAAGHAAEAAAALPFGDVLLVAGGFADELEAARVLLVRPWRAAAFVGAGVEEVLAPLGPARKGLLGPCQWLARVAPPPDEGPDAAWFVDAFRASEGHEPPYPAAAAFAAGLLCARCLREVGQAGDSALLGAAARQSVRTLFGQFRLDPATGLQVGHELLTVQWQQGTRRVVWPPQFAERALISPLPLLDPGRFGR